MSDATHARNPGSRPTKPLDGAISESTDSLLRIYRHAGRRFLNLPAATRRLRGLNGGAMTK
jgi:hypothetical protein